MIEGTERLQSSGWWGIAKQWVFTMLRVRNEWGSEMNVVHGTWFRVKVLNDGYPVGIFTK